MNRSSSCFARNRATRPEVDVRGAAFVDGRVLMVREISDGRWTLPGGWADVNQSAGECVVREIAEESGFKARALKLAAVYDYQRSGHPPRHIDSIYKMFSSAKSRAARRAPATRPAKWPFSLATNCPPYPWQDHRRADRAHVSSRRAPGTRGGFRLETRCRRALQR